MPGLEHTAPKAFPTTRVAIIGGAWCVLLVSLGLQARPSAQQAASPVTGAQPSPPTSAAPLASGHRQTMERVGDPSHNQRLVTAGFKLDEANVASPGEGPELWEKVVRKLRTCMMPPP